MKRPELLIPAGDLEKLRTAVLYGADAVYLGVEGLSLRADQAETGMDDIRIGIREAHAKKVRVYAAVNTFLRNQDLGQLREKTEELAEAGVDAVIISDPGALRVVKNTRPGLPVHLSTQANTTNAEAVRFWRDQGVKRIVLARELTLKEIGEISAAVPDLELEIFVHGAMCMAYSGRCYLSAYYTGRSSNRGECTHPCRWEYLLVESMRPDDPLILEEDDRYSYILSAKDLCMIEYIPEIMGAGVSSLKIEGRMKSVYYVAVVTRTYRWALEAAWTAAANGGAYRPSPEWMAELSKISNRGYTTGFYFTDRAKISETTPHSRYRQTHSLAGTVLEYDRRKGRILVGIRNQVTSGDTLELLLPDETLRLDPREMTDLEGQAADTVHNSYLVYFPVDREVPAGAVIRKAVDY